MTAGVWSSPPHPESAAWLRASSQCPHSVSTLITVTTDVHWDKSHLKQTSQSVHTLRSSSAWLATSSVCFSFSLLYRCSVACDLSAQWWQHDCSSTASKDNQNNQKMTYFLLRCRTSARSHDRHYAGAKLPAPYAAVHFPQAHVVFVHAVPLILPPNCWFGTSVA